MRITPLPFESRFDTFDKLREEEVLLQRSRRRIIRRSRKNWEKQPVLQQSSHKSRRGKRQKSRTSQTTWPLSMRKLQHMQKYYRCHPGKQIDTCLLQYWSILLNQYLIKSQVLNSGTPKGRVSRGEGGTEQAVQQVMTKLKASTVPQYRSHCSFIVWSKQDCPCSPPGLWESRQSGHMKGMELEV